MKYLKSILALVYGLFWLVFGMNGFAHFFMPPEPHGQAADFMNALENTGYIMPLVYAGQIVAGLMLLTGRFIPLALIILGPVVINIFLYDLFLNASGLPIGVIIALIYAALIFINRKFFIFLIKP